MILFLIKMKEMQPRKLAFYQTELQQGFGVQELPFFIETLVSLN